MSLAIDGGTPIRTHPMPAREAFGPTEEAELFACIRHYRSLGQDPPYNGRWNKLFSEAFAEYQGGGHALPVSSGTGAVYVALAALGLPPGAVVLTSPVTCSGVIGAMLALGLRPKVVDSAPRHLNIDAKQVEQRLDDHVRGIVVTHAGGEPVDVPAIQSLIGSRNIAILEDCSQAAGANLNGEKVGTWGHISAFSTMYRKNLAAGASSGLVFTKDYATYRRAITLSDRGKPLWRLDLNLNDPGSSLHPALNWNSSEMSNAIGLASLRRLDDTNHRRRQFLEKLIRVLKEQKLICQPSAYHSGFAPFYFPIFVDTQQLCVSAEQFALALQAEGIPLGAKYGCVVHTWPWTEELLFDRFIPSNALETRNQTFNLHLNENYGHQEITDITTAIKKVSTAYLRK